MLHLIRRRQPAYRIDILTGQPLRCTVEFHGSRQEAVTAAREHAERGAWTWVRVRAGNDWRPVTTFQP